MVDLLWFLLPVAAWSGWVAATRFHSKHQAMRKPDDLEPRYYEGLNYVLNEQPDKAIDVFLRMLETEDDTVELHLAVGALFRRRGETERAIRIHQSLVSRPRLERSHRDLALLELGRDYLSAGLLDRAEAVFAEIQHSPTVGEAGLKHLVDVYQQERDWEKAIDAAQRFEVASGQKQGAMVAHFYCELAESVLASGGANAGTDEVMRYLVLAKAADPLCVRTYLLQSRVELRLGRPRFALTILTTSPATRGAVLAETVDLLMQCYEQLGSSSDVGRTIEELLAHDASGPAMSGLARLLESQHGPVLAREMVGACMERTPSLDALHRYLELIGNKSDLDLRVSVDTVSKVVGELVGHAPRHRCERCGFTAHSMHWQCPSCKSWGRVKTL